MRIASSSLAISVCCLLCTIWLSSPATAQGENIVRRLDVSAPRDFGYTIGDKIERTIILELEKPYVLDEDSLPRGGKLGYWLELQPPTLRRFNRPESIEYIVGLTYQPFLLVEKPQQAVIPRVELSVGNGTRDLMLVVPEWAFALMPLVQRDNLGGLPELSPAMKPAQLATTPYLYRAFAFSVGLLAALLYLAYVLWGKPYLLRRNRPFARALRRIRKLERAGQNETRYQDALRVVHEAINGTAGSVVFAESLDQFVVHHPEFGGIRDNLESFFSESRAVFFRSGEVRETQENTLHSLVELCRKGRTLEQELA